MIIKMRDGDYRIKDLPPRGKKGSDINETKIIDDEKK